MITYTLVCSDGHSFEGWFRDSAAYDAQATGGHVVCPVCGSAQIVKAPMAPAVVGGAASKTRTRAPHDDAGHMRQFVTGLRKYIQDNAEYVGPRFAEEARKIHYGETDERHIYGEATLTEAKQLVEEGVEIAPVPPAPEEMN